ncbi:SagB/ThcOx family dehydrogenase [Thermosipho ferrireducens]|uniref:SagB/ThcOx family dehydrogenase n=1 Tax=Thermosipho ferrireducens TaxID=2571116 RepID=A0ABX7SAW4_9BACT|nr:SagB/ThcOx family dehydrogenase [Thermosipho ferrireducens]QTA38598.1 SagB/ThcOx family dehydrogenase [Thermosipho ferrireducens]
MKTRDFLKSNWKILKTVTTDQRKGIPHPPIEKPYPENSKLIDLPEPETLKFGNVPLKNIIEKRRSRRKFIKTPLNLEELSYLLWLTQGVKEIIRNGIATFRNVPSAGARHPFETYLVVFNIENLNKGIYRYIPLKHKLILLKEGDFSNNVIEATLNQKFVGESAVVFVWTAIPYRTEWRYAQESYKAIALDAGHVCQNLYLAAESINSGTCAIGAYDQELMDKLIGVDGNEEFVIYLAPVGKINE